jgi:hypothetical protein
MDYIKNIFATNKYSKKCQKIIKNHGEDIIEGITIMRHALPSAITYFSNNLTSEEQFDKLFHLYMIITTNRGKILIEKNENINMDTNIPNIKSAESYIIHNIPQGIKLRTFLDNCRKRMGDSLYFDYNVSSNNCQYYVMNLLLANNITDGIQFVKQNTGSIFKNHPILRKSINSIVDIASYGDRILGGELI